MTNTDECLGGFKSRSTCLVKTACDKTQKDEYMKEPINFYERLHNMPLEVNGWDYVIRRPSSLSAEGYMSRLWIFPDEKKPGHDNLMVIYIDIDWEDSSCISSVVKRGAGTSGQLTHARVQITRKDILTPHDFVMTFLYNLVSEIQQAGLHLCK